MVDVHLNHQRKNAAPSVGCRQVEAKTAAHPVRGRLGTGCLQGPRMPNKQARKAQATQLAAVWQRSMYLVAMIGIAQKNEGC